MGYQPKPGKEQPPKKVSFPETSLKYRVERTTNCPNCNASLSSDICEYCGTRVGWDEGTVHGAFRSEPVTIPVYIKGEQVETVVRHLADNRCFYSERVHCFNNPFDEFGQSAASIGFNIDKKEQ